MPGLKSYLGSFLLHIIRTANVLYERTLLLKPVLNCEMKELATNVGKFVFSVSQLNECVSMKKQMMVTIFIFLLWITSSSQQSKSDI